MADVAVDPAELTRQLEHVRERERAVSRVLAAVARAEGLQSVLDEIVASAKKLCRGDSAQLYLAEGDLFRIFSQGLDSKEAYAYAQQNPHRRNRTTIVGRVGLSRQVERIPDVLSDPDYSYDGQALVGYRALLGVPILLEGELIGAIAVARQEAGDFTESEVELVRTFADQAAVAIGNARLLETVQRQLSQQRAVGGVMRSVARSRGLQTVLDDIVRSATVLTGVENGRLYLLTDGLLYAVANQGSEENFEHDRQHPHEIDRSTLTGRAALTRQAVHIADVLEDPEYTYAGDGSGLPYRSGVTVPILLEEELIGALGMVSEHPGAFADEHVELLQTFADQAAIAIANARLIETVERQLEQQQTVGDVLRTVARGGGLQPVLEAVVEAASRLAGGEYGLLCLAEGDVLRVVAHHGSADLFAHDEGRIHARNRATAIGRVALEKRAVQIPDVLADAEYSWPAQKVVGYRAVLGVPILLEDQLIGAMAILRDAPGPYAQEHVELANTFADQAAIAITNARLIEAIERQRTELSRFVSPQVADLLSSDEAEKLLAGHRGYVTILFCDLRGFTAFTETAEPEELFEVLRDYHAAIGELIPRYEGTLEHFQGDGLMVFFNDPAPVEDHELKAIGLALAAQERLAELTASWRKRGIQLDLGIGIASGYATLGRVGFEGRYDYGALGSVTNLAARLTTSAGPAQTLISQRVYAAVEERVEAEPVGELELKGIGRPVVAYEVRGLR